MLALTMETEPRTITCEALLGQLSLIDHTLAIDIWPDIAIQKMAFELHIRKRYWALLELALALEV